MQALTLHIELFALQRLLFRFYNLLCRTARCAQSFVPEVNLICTNIFMCKVLRKYLKELHYKDTTIISKMQAKKRRSLTSHRHFVTNGFYAPLYKTSIKITIFQRKLIFFSGIIHIVTAHLKKRHFVNNPVVVNNWESL